MPTKTRHIMRRSTAVVEPTKPTLKCSGRVQAMLECLRCYAPLKVGEDRCDCSQCDASYPVCDGIPVLIDNSTSLFQTNDFTERKSTFFRPRSRSNPLVLSSLPEISHNIRAKANYRKFPELLLARNKRPIVLVVGGSIPAKGMNEILACGDIEFVETDVSCGPRTSLTCDPTQLPVTPKS